MARIYGREMKKSEILKKVGDIEQIAHILSMELQEGDASGVKALDIRNGSGLRFTVVADRGLDITTAEFYGIPLSIRFHPGEMRPNFHEDLPFAFIKSWAGGLVTTCGLTQVGDPEKMVLKILFSMVILHIFLQKMSSMKANGKAMITGSRSGAE